MVIAIIVIIRRVAMIKIIVWVLRLLWLWGSAMRRSPYVYHLNWSVESVGLSPNLWWVQMALFVLPHLIWLSPIYVIKSQPAGYLPTYQSDHGPIRIDCSACWFELFPSCKASSGPYTSVRPTYAKRAYNLPSYHRALYFPPAHWSSSAPFQIPQAYLPSVQEFLIPCSQWSVSSMRWWFLVGYEIWPKVAQHSSSTVP